MNDEIECEIKMYFVRVVRNSCTASQVWSAMKDAFPDVDIEQIRKICKPIAEKMI